MVPWTLLFLSTPLRYLEVYLKSDGTSFSKSRSSVKEHIWILCFIPCQDHFSFPEACIKCSYLSNGRWDHVIPDLRFLDNALTLGQQKLTIVKPSTKYLHRVFTYAWELWRCAGILLSRESPCFYKLTLFTWLSSQLKFLILQCLLETFHKGFWFSPLVLLHLQLCDTAEREFTHREIITFTSVNFLDHAVSSSNATLTVVSELSIMWCS